MKFKCNVIIGLLLVALFSLTVQGYSIEQEATKASGITINIYEVNDLETPLQSYYQSDDEAYKLFGFTFPIEEMYIAHLKLDITSMSGTSCPITLASLYSDANSQTTAYLYHVNNAQLNWNYADPHLSYTDLLTGISNSHSLWDSGPTTLYIGVNHQYGDKTTLNIYLSEGQYTDYGATNIIIKDIDGHSIASYSITHQDIHDNIVGDHFWRYKRIEVDPDTNEIKLILCLYPSAPQEYVINTGLKLSKLYTAFVTDSQGNQYTYENNIIDLTSAYPDLIPPATHNFVLHVNHKFEEAISIPINLYDHNGRTLYVQKVVKGSYIDYTLSMMANENNTAVCTMVFACDSDISSVTFRIDLKDDGDRIKGLALSPNSVNPDFVYNGEYGQSIYKGRFYPEDKYTALNLYIVSEAEMTNIKVVYSYEYNNTVDRLCESYYTKNEQLKNKVEQLKQEANKTIDNAIEQLPNFFDGEQSAVVSDFFEGVYQVPFVLSMITLAISICILSYVLFGKKE